MRSGDGRSEVDRRRRSPGRSAERRLHPLNPRALLLGVGRHELSWYLLLGLVAARWPRSGFGGERRLGGVGTRSQGGGLVAACSRRVPAFRPPALPKPRPPSRLSNLALKRTRTPARQSLATFSRRISKISAGGGISIFAPFQQARSSHTLFILIRRGPPEPGPFDGPRSRPPSAPNRSAAAPGFILRRARSEPGSLRT